MSSGENAMLVLLVRAIRLLGQIIIYKIALFKLVQCIWNFMEYLN